MPQNLTIFDEPQCLIDTGPDGKLIVNELVQKQLKKLNKEVVVVTIAGPYRTGKSYLMNMLADQKKGFALGSTIQAETKGVWIWAREHPRQANKCLILLDTEGLGDVEKGDENHDNQFLCLAILLSSTMVYNVKGVIGNEALQKLHFVTELSKYIQIHNTTDQGSKTDDSNFHFYFPDFVYALRDFTLELKIDGREVTADEYLEHSLTMKEGNQTEIKNHNEIRNCIRRYFKKRKCFTFVPPVAGKCINLDEVPDEELVPDFVNETKAFVEYILSESQIKQARERRLTGRMLGSLVEDYVKQLSTGMPCVENAVDAVANSENIHAMEEAVAHFYEKMTESFKMPVFDDSVLPNFRKTCFQGSIDLFLSKAFCDKDHVYQEKLKDEINKKYEEIVKKNEETCKIRCDEIIQHYYYPIEKKIGEGYYTKKGGFRLYKNDIKQFTKHFMREEKHLANKMLHVLLEFLRSKQTEEEVIMQADEKVTDAERQKEAESQKALEEEKLRKAAEREAQLQKSMKEEQEKAHKENIERMENKMKEDVEETRQYYELMMDERLHEQKHLLRESFEKEKELMQSRVDDVKFLSTKLRPTGCSSCTII